MRVCLGLALALILGACGATSQSHPLVLPMGSSGNVMLVTDAPTYRTSQPIGVTVRNNGNVTYFVQDGYSACTILRLQRLSGNMWRDEMPCAFGRSGAILQLPPGTSEPFTLAPGNAPDDPNAWLPGHYRVALDIGTQPDGSGAVTLVSSAGFQIR